MEYEIELNLMNMKGATLQTDDNGLDCVIIPAQDNDIKPWRDAEGVCRYATVRLKMREVNEAYKMKCADGAAKRGTDMRYYTPPSHSVEPKYSKDFYERARNAAASRILGEHPEWQGMDVTDFRNPLAKAVADAVRINLGNATPMQVYRQTDENMGRYMTGQVEAQYGKSPL